MPHRLLYKSSVRRDLKQIEPKEAERLLKETRNILTDNPRSSEALRGEFRGLFKLRIGNYRVIYTQIGEDVLVLRIRRNSKAYE